MKIGERDSLELLNTNIKIFKEIPKELTSWELSKLLKIVRYKNLSSNIKNIISSVNEIEELLNDLFLGLSVMEDKGCWVIYNKWFKYRQIYINKKYKWIISHRIAYELFIDSIVLPQICHHCDRPGCCNPWHLFQGTQTINNKDAKVKGRFNRTKGLTQPEKFLLHRHLNNVGHVIKVDPLDNEWYKNRTETEVTERAKDADKFFGKMK